MHRIDLLFLRTALCPAFTAQSQNPQGTHPHAEDARSILRDSLDVATHPSDAWRPRRRAGTVEHMPEDLPPQPPPPAPHTGFPAAGAAGYAPPPAAAQRPPYAGYPPAGYAFGAYPPPGYAPPSRRSGWIWAAVAAGLVTLCVVLFCVFISSLAKTVASAGGDTPLAGEDSIAVLDISGVITDAGKTEKQLRKFAADPDVKAIILHIDSPGGGAAVSQELYHDVLRVKAETHKPIVASVESVGASGAYYIASACDKIYANPASVVGSIGVIMEWTNYGDLMRWAKLKPVVITHGELKDAGDPTRDVTPKEQAYFQSLVDNMYSQFVHDVATGRHTDDARITPLATGQVWTGEQALGLGLIDTEGGFRTALLDTAHKVGITGEPHIVRPEKERHGLLAMLNGEQGDDLFPNPSKLLDRAPGFYFLWR